MIISKSDYTTYLKHPAWLWIKKHAKDKLPPTSPNLQALFDEGNNYESYAEQLFPDGVRLSWDPKDYGSYDALIVKTQAEIDKGTKTIFQGRFMSGNLTFICDIIDRTENGEWDLYEIKATTRVKEEHKPDLSFQQVVLEQLGYKVHNIYVIHLDNEYTKQGSLNIEGLSTIKNVTDEIKALKPITEERIPFALEVANSDTMPDLSPRNIGISGCKNEWMEIFRLLNPDIPQYSIYDLAGRNSEVVSLMEDQDIIELAKIPEETKISGKKAKMQLQVTKQNSVIVNKDKIQKFLGDLEYPLYFLDYESIKKAVPPYNGTRPYQQIVFQYSVHTLESPDSELKHDMYLHTEDSNPIEPLTESLRNVIGPEGSVIVWHKVFERDRNREMGDYDKAYFDFYQDLNDRMIDLEVPFQQDWYAMKEFKGSSSIKAVLPVLIPDLSYKELEIQDGLTTGRIWTEIVIDKNNDADKEKMFEEMRKYNTLDTLAMVEIYTKLKVLI
jgi:hypothetical protein